MFYNMRNGNQILRIQIDIKDISNVKKIIWLFLKVLIINLLGKENEDQKVFECRHLWGLYIKCNP